MHILQIPYFTWVLNSANQTFCIILREHKIREHQIFIIVSFTLYLSKKHKSQILKSANVLLAILRGYQFLDINRNLQQCKLCNFVRVKYSLYLLCVQCTCTFLCMTGLQDALSDMSFSLDSSRIDNNTSLQQEQPVLLTPEAFSTTSPRQST